MKAKCYGSWCTQKHIAAGGNTHTDDVAITGSLARKQAYVRKFGIQVLCFK